MEMTVTFHFHREIIIVIQQSFFRNEVPKYVV